MRRRMAALARYLMIDSLNPAITAATQWFERTLELFPPGNWAAC